MGSCRFVAKCMESGVTNGQRNSHMFKRRTHENGMTKERKSLSLLELL